MQQPHILLVDDDTILRKSLSRIIKNWGFEVDDYENAVHALARLQTGPIDVVLSDISMDHMDGITFLREIRSINSDLPVILMTGNPSLQTAIDAVGLGASLYIPKPFDYDNLKKELTRLTRLGALARAKRQALELQGSQGPSDRLSLESAFERALPNIWPAFQPVVYCDEKRIFAYEALMRSGEPSFRGPMELLDAAERLGQVHRLGRTLRERVAGQLPTLPTGINILVNIHPHDLLDPELYSPTAPLTRLAPRVILEITERASLDGIDGISSRVKHLRKLGFRIAIDDLGAGYAGLTSLLHLQPEIVKLDMGLVHTCDTDDARRMVLGSLGTLCKDLGMLVVAEGVETPAERDTLCGLGLTLQQGYLYARPAPNWTVPAWEL